MSLGGYISALASEAAMPSNRAGHAVTEPLSAGRCDTCGARGHDHTRCPGVEFQAPADNQGRYEPDPLEEPWGERR